MNQTNATQRVIAAVGTVITVALETREIRATELP